MPEVVGIRFKCVTKVYYFDPGELGDLSENDPVIVETALGEELGWVVLPPHAVGEDEIKGKLKAVIRRADPVDLAEMEDFRQREASALEKARDKAAELGLPMKIIKAEYGFNGQRLLFSFISDERVDFRELVRALARSFRTRIEMKQIGARDEAKIIGGYGPCGRQLCCISWLTEFHPVSIKMAKQQDLPLTPTEISGLCGRLLCCLAYENDLYVDVKEKLPKRGAQVATPQGKGVIVGVNVLAESLIVELQNEMIIEAKYDEIEVLAEGIRSSRARKKRRR
jgi:cell fate regulator YaaT (PSP1 superfamily)